jgi:hypothetical protein
MKTRNLLILSALCAIAIVVAFLLQLSMVR